MAGLLKTLEKSCERYERINKVHCCHLSGDEFVIVWETKICDVRHTRECFESVQEMLNSIQGQIDSDVPDTGIFFSEFPIPGKMTISAGCTFVETNFSDAKKDANEALDFAKKKRASIGYKGIVD